MVFGVTGAGKTGLTIRSIKNLTEQGGQPTTNSTMHVKMLPSINKVLPYLAIMPSLGIEKAK